MRIVLTGGGTGGHITPLIAVADRLRKLEQNHEVRVPKNRNGKLELRYVGPVSEMDKRMLDKAEIPYDHISSGKIRRYASGVPLTIFDLMFRLPWGTLRALWRMYVFMPEAVLSKGGHGSVPVTIACWVYRIPVLMHETDTVPGLANRRLARFVTAIGVGFRTAEKYFPKKKVFVSGIPTRAVFHEPPSLEDAKRALGLHDRKPILFIVGGSQGAQRINNVILEMLVVLLPEFQIVHQVGTLHEKPVKNFIDSTFADFPDIDDYHFYGFLEEDEIASAYVAADLVIARAGGTTLAEIAAIGRASILVPLRQSAGNHQWENAYIFRESGAALVLDETNLAPSLLETTIRKMFADPAQLDRMAERSKQIIRPAIDEDLAMLLVTMGGGFAPRRAVPEHASSQSNDATPSKPA